MKPSLLKSIKQLQKARYGNDVWNYTYPEWSSGQEAFLNDKSLKQLIRGPRRSGKTQVIAEAMLRDSQTPVTLADGTELYGPVVYITQTRELAKKIMWQELKDMARKRAMSAITNEVDLTMKFPNGASIELQGAGLNDSANKARGRKTVSVNIDEAAFIGPLKELCEIWTPTLADYNGTLRLSSSPGKSLSGFFYECDMGSQSQHWARFYLNPAENPAFKGGKYEKFRQEQLKTMYGGNEQHPTFRREWLGEWVVDNSNLLIKYDPTRNLYTDKHTKNNELYTYVLGLDLGYLDSTAISVAAVAKYEPEAIFVDEFVKPEMRIAEIIETVEKYSKKWNADAIVVDSGGLGQHTYQELINREGLPAVDRAQKYGKKLNIETLNNELYSGRIKVLPECTKTIEAWKKVLKNEKGTEDEKCDYGSQGVLDILDASLYTAMELFPSIHDQLQLTETEEQRMKRKRFERHEKAQKAAERWGMKGFL